VENYLNGQSSINKTAQEAGVNWSTIKRWIAIYENEGPTGLLPTKKNRHYSKERKSRSRSILSGWI
ncbi:helix-turn-helix domain-containing protein, partial [Enterococcus italicus]|uniref:helix-turn-helix domain-containing protein n=1 Tax=Enterococcus italicus TaxID=246144 RepID=UPI0012DF5B33